MEQYIRRKYKTLLCKIGGNVIKRTMIIALVLIAITISLLPACNAKTNSDMISTDNLSELFDKNKELFVNSAQEFSDGQQSAIISIEPGSQKICITDINNSPKTVYENVGYSIEINRKVFYNNIFF